MDDSDATATAGKGLVHDAVELLGRRIVRGEIEPGKTLPVEQDLTDELGISRNVLREAVKTLTGKNMLRSARRLGVIVEPRDNWNMLDPQVIRWMLAEQRTRGSLLQALSELRAIIEPEAAALAAERASTEQIERLMANYEDMARYASDPDEAVRHDVAFHRTLLEATGNSLLRTFAEGFGLLLSANFELSIKVDNAFIRNLEDHRLIAEAINDRDPERARAVSRKLLRKNESDLREMRERLRGGGQGGGS